MLHALEDGTRTRLAKIVTPFREPIGWLVSRTFQAVYRTAGTAHTAAVREIAAFCMHLRAIADVVLRHRSIDSDSLMDEIAARLDPAAVEALQVYAQVPQPPIGRANANDEDGNSEA